MLTIDQPRCPGAVHIQAIPVPAAVHRRRWLRAAPGGLMAALLLASAALAHTGGGFGKDTAPRVAAASLSATPYDVAPSAMREQTLDRREAGIGLPGAGAYVLELQNRQNALEIQQEKELVARYFSEIQSRDSDIARLNQTVQTNQASLAQLAVQLGLPKDRLPETPPAEDKGVGAATPADLAAISHDGPAPAPAAIAPISSATDLANLVGRYLSLPCPLPSGDARCGQAVDHARAELARGHGLDSNRPDALPVLNMDVAQPFGPTNVDMEPVQDVNGQQFHFHDGVDLAAAYDEPVMAAASGTVVYADVAPSGAETIEIAHAGGIHTVYLHEEQMLVQVGQHVDKGQIIGLVGSTGMSTGPHVHFMIEDASGKPIDPMPYLDPSWVRPAETIEPASASVPAWTPPVAPAPLLAAPRISTPITRSPSTAVKAAAVAPAAVRPAAAAPARTTAAVRR
jgi:murein DD-endopeptidase MepM/ murein hydrolase activator NlpD